MTSATIVWFRNDLRVSDHPALHAAATEQRPVVPVYILDDLAPGAWRMGGARRWWLHHSLQSLAGDLAARGIPLILRRGDAVEVISEIVREINARAV